MPYDDQDRAVRAARGVYDEPDGVGYRWGVGVWAAATLWGFGVCIGIGWAIAPWFL